MSLETTIKDALAGIVTQITPDVTKDLPVYPLIVYQQVGGQVAEFLEGKVADKDHARVQIWVWAKTRIEASTVARQARVALVEGATKATTYGAPVSRYDEALKLYGNRTDYGIWYTP